MDLFIILLAIPAFFIGIIGGVYLLAIFEHFFNWLITIIFGE